MFRCFVTEPQAIGVKLMAELNNSQRRVPKATYVPLTLPPAAQAQSGRVVEKVAMLKSLKLDASEFASLSDLPEVGALKVSSKRGGKPDTAVVDVIRKFMSTPTATALKLYGATIAQ